MRICAKGCAHVRTYNELFKDALKTSYKLNALTDISEADYLVCLVIRAGVWHVIVQFQRSVLSEAARVELAQRRHERGPRHRLRDVRPLPQVKLVQDLLLGYLDQVTFLRALLHRRHAARRAGGGGRVRSSHRDRVQHHQRGQHRGRKPAQVRPRERHQEHVDFAFALSV